MFMLDSEDAKENVTLELVIADMSVTAAVLLSVTTQTGEFTYLFCGNVLVGDANVRVQFVMLAPVDIFPTLFEPATVAPLPQAETVTELVVNPRLLPILV